MENTHELSNEELMYIYYNNKKLVDKFDKAFEEKALKSVVPTPFGLIMTRRKLSEEDINTLRNEPEYVISKNIINKLSIIIEFIESTGDDYSYIKKIFEQEEMFPPKEDLEE